MAVVATDNQDHLTEQDRNSGKSSVKEGFFNYIFKTLIYITENSTTMFYNKNNKIGRGGVKMAKRQIVHIDEERCNGCGLCVPNCAEGAIEIVNGKAKLISENLCDGLGACLGNCPLDAITIIERDADEFDEEAVKIHLGQKKLKEKALTTLKDGLGCGCPGTHAKEIKANKEKNNSVVADGDVVIKIKPQLRQWPVQLKLVSSTAPYLREADLLVTADCVPFAYPDYHLELLKGKKVVVGCPKLDDIDFYRNKLLEMIKINRFRSITVTFMEVPCCTGILRTVENAIEESGLDIPLHKVRIGLEGEAVRI
jgi:ferredoxin